MDPVVAPLAEMASLHDRLFRNCLDGVTEEQALVRPGDRTNNMAFIALHMVDARFWLAGYLGADVANPLEERLKDVESVEEMDPAAYPPLDVILDGWAAAGRALTAQLEAATAASLAETSRMPFPVDDPSMLGALTFLLHHEASHVGQLAMLRRYVGHDGMSYG